MNMPATAMPAPSISDALREVAMIAKVSTTAFGLTRTDHSASAEIDAAKHAKKGTSSLKVNRLAGVDDLHNAIKVVQKQAQDNLAMNATPWGGARHCLPNANFERWVGEHYRLQTKHEELKAELATKVDEIIADAVANLVEYKVEPPNREELLNAYSLTYKLEPIPAADFPNMPPAAEEWLKRQYEANLESTYHEATNAALARLIDPLSKLVEKIDLWDKRDDREKETGKKVVLREATLGNVQEVLDVLGSFNLLNEPAFKAFEEQCVLFRNVSTEDIRGNDELRASVKTRAQEVIDGLRGWLGPTE